MGHAARRSSSGLRVLFLAASLSLAACGGGDSPELVAAPDPAPAPTPPPPAPPPAPEPPPPPPPEPPPPAPPPPAPEPPAPPPPAPSPPPSAGTAADCLDASLHAAGTRFELDYRTAIAGTIVQTGRTINEVLGVATFNGQSATELRSTITVLTGPGAGSDAEGRTYFRLDGLDLLTFGNVATISLGGSTGTSTTVHAPPWILRYSLAAGQSFSQAYAETTTTTGLPFNVPPVTTSVSLTHTFDGFEDVAVPAGTFAGACRWTIVDTRDGTTTTSTQWLTRKGVPVRMVTGDTESVLTAGTVNGGPVGP